jgi:hypothetical protein
MDTLTSESGLPVGDNADGEDDGGGVVLKAKTN